MNLPATEDAGDNISSAAGDAQGGDPGAPLSDGIPTPEDPGGDSQADLGGDSQADPGGDSQADLGGDSQADPGGDSVSICCTPVNGSPPNLDTELAWWMEYVDDSASLADLTIPGTHNSGALYESFSGTAKCQDLTIAEQLDTGVRYLDIRLRHIDDALVVHHGSVYQHLNFDDVLTQVTGFLAAHSSEVVVMEVSEEYNSASVTRTFEETFNTYAEDSTYSRYWWRHSYVPTVGDVRGKIVLLRRFSGSFWVSGGIDVTAWEDNAEFIFYDTREVAINVQDYYWVNAWTNDNKWQEIAEHLSAAESDAEGSLFISFTSGVRSVLGIPNIPGVAEDINARLLDYFRSVEIGNPHHGVIISDFITSELVRAELRPYFY